MKTISIFGTLIGLLDNEANIQNNVAKLLFNKDDIIEIDSISEFNRLVASNKMAIINIDSNNSNGFEIAKILHQSHPEISVLTLTSNKHNTNKWVTSDESAPSFDFAKLASAIVDKKNLMSQRKIWMINRTDLLLIDPYGHSYNMSPYEMVLLTLLAENLGKIVHRQQIAKTMGIEWEQFDGRQLDQRVSRLRKRWKQLTNKDLPVKTAHGQGYIFCEEVTIV